MWSVIPLCYVSTLSMWCLKRPELGWKERGIGRRIRVGWCRFSDTTSFSPGTSVFCGDLWAGDLHSCCVLLQALHHLEDQLVAPQLLCQPRWHLLLWRLVRRSRQSLKLTLLKTPWTFRLLSHLTTTGSSSLQTFWSRLTLQCLYSWNPKTTIKLLDELTQCFGPTEAQSRSASFTAQRACDVHRCSWKTGASLEDSLPWSETVDLKYSLPASCEREEELVRLWKTL